MTELPFVRDVAADLSARVGALETELALVAARGLAHLAALGEVEDAAAATQARLQGALERLEAWRRAEGERVRDAAAAAVAGADTRVEAAARRAAEAEAELLLMRRSTVWRVTGPIRAAVGFVRARLGSVGGGQP